MGKETSNFRQSTKALQLQWIHNHVEKENKDLIWQHFILSEIGMYLFTYGKWSINDFFGSFFWKKIGIQS